MIKTCEEWLIEQMIVLPFRGTSTGWGMEPFEVKHSGQMLLGRNNPGHQNRLGTSQLGRCLAEKAL